MAHFFQFEKRKFDSLVVFRTRFRVIFLNQTIRNSPQNLTLFNKKNQSLVSQRSLIFKSEEKSNSRPSQRFSLLKEKWNFKGFQWIFLFKNKRKLELEIYKVDVQQQEMYKDKIYLQHFKGNFKVFMSLVKTWFLLLRFYDSFSKFLTH